MRQKKLNIKKRCVKAVSLFLAVALVISLALPIFADSTAEEVVPRNILSLPVDISMQWDSSRSGDPTLTQFDSPLRWRSFHGAQWYYGQSSLSSTTTVALNSGDGAYPVKTTVSWNPVTATQNITYSGLLIEKTYPYPGSDPSELENIAPSLYIQCPAGWYSTASDPIEDVIFSFPNVDFKYAEEPNPPGGYVDSPLFVTGRAFLHTINREDGSVERTAISYSTSYSWWTVSPLAFVKPFNLTHHFDPVIGADDYLLTDVEFTLTFTDVLLDNLSDDPTVAFPYPVDMMIDCPAEYYRNTVNYSSRWFNAKGIKFSSWQVDADVNSFLSSSVGGFLEFEIIPGISILGILLTVVGIALTVAFLKFFAGG